MKITTAVIAVLLLLIAAGAASSQEPPKSKKVQLAVTTIAVRATAHTRTDALLLWNRAVRTRPVGHAIKSCITVTGGKIFGRGLFSCDMNISLPLGKVTASGIIYNLRRYTLVITGGTGVYEGVTGPLFMRSIAGDGVRQLSFRL